MIVSATLLKALQKRVTLLEEDLRRRCDADPQVNAPLQAQYAAARESKRTAETFNAWRDEQITQIAVAWVLACVFVRFLEDNQLLDTPFLAGPDAARMNRARDEQELFFKQHPTASERDYLLHVFDAVGQLPSMREFFDRRHNPLWLAGPTGDALAGLLDFWRKTNPDTGALVRDFTDADWNTRFLGDLYQDLSEAARKRFALLQTPVFVEEFILDRTLTPAIDTFGYKVVRMIDPTCGSGHFCLSGFRRLFRLWQQGNPAENPRVLAQRALDGVYGVDLNPYAVAIARFRLLLAALLVSGINKLKNAPDFRIHLAVGDSLLHGRRFREHESFTAGPQMTFNTEEVFRDELNHHYEVEDTEALHRILGQPYHAVVGNPPYITVKDRALSDLYRGRYRSCHRQYSLSVPFMERFFDLAVKGDGQRQPAGFVGQITANSFMKREFGKKLIEEYLHRWDLTHVIDTSGTYIPGQGTPTVVLFGKNQPPVAPTIRTVMGIKGEPATPEDPARGVVWNAILRQVDQPGSESDFVSVADSHRESIHRHPWCIGGGGAAELKAELEQISTTVLNDEIETICSVCYTRLDDVYLVTRDVLNRAHIPSSQQMDMVSGSAVRHWSLQVEAASAFPYNSALTPVEPSHAPAVLAFLWPYREDLWRRKELGGDHRQRNRTWWEWNRFLGHRFKNPLSIVYAEIATHNHFVFDRGGKVFTQTSPTIKPKDGSSENFCLGLSGLLNCSTGCFWMKQVFFPKGGDHVGSEGARVRTTLWDERYAHDASKLKQFPVPAEKPLSLARELDHLAQELKTHAPAVVLRHAAGQGSALREALATAHQQWTDLLQRMIALQEELDWECYRIYGVAIGEWRVASGAEALNPDVVPPLHLGERAFEIVMARKMAQGELETAWFERHGSTPITEVPSHWPVAYRELVERRIRLIVDDPKIRLIEQPEYKRRWNTEPWDDQQERALRQWLLKRLEGYFFEGDRVCRLEDGFSPAAHGFRAATQPALVSTNQLAELVQADAAFLKVAEVYVGAAGFSVPKLVRELVEEESVPFLPFQRYKESGLRKRQDWERTWELQRKEDVLELAIADCRLVMEKQPERSDELKSEIESLKSQMPDIPVPPKYASGDFKASTFWRLRGKLDVSKERWLSYPGAAREGDPSPVIAWAGWNHLQQAQALAEYYLTAKDTWGWSSERLTLLLAGLADLLPWLKQWHNEMNPECGMGLADYFAGFLDEEAREQEATMEALGRIRFGRGQRAGGA